MSIAKRSARMWSGSSKSRGATTHNPYIEQYENLANGIIEAAVDDFRQSWKHIKKCKAKLSDPEIDEKEEQKCKDEIEAAESQMNKIRKFFRSQWYGELTKVDGSYLLKHLEEELV